MNYAHASDYYVVPAIPDFLSNVGLSILAHQIQDFLDVTEDERPKGERAECLGVIFTKVRSWFREHSLQKTSVATALKELIAAKVVEKDAEILEPDIRDSVRLQEAAGRFLPLCEYKPNSSITSDYAEITKAIRKKVGV